MFDTTIILREENPLDLLILNTQIEDWVHFTRVGCDSRSTIKHLAVELSILIQGV